MVSLNPLSAGRSFQTNTFRILVAGGRVLIPYQQGGLFRRRTNRYGGSRISLNPLSAGRSFQTQRNGMRVVVLLGLNPLSAGRSFQTVIQPGIPLTSAES